MNMISRRRSNKREKVLDMLKHSGAISAAALHKKLPGMNLTTVYRNLEIFVKDGIATRFSLGGDEALYEYAKEPHHHAICVDCDKVIHFHAPAEKIKKLLDLQDFDVESMEITVRGKCRR